MKIGIVISTNDPETIWNALRLANFSLGQSDKVTVFFMGKGVEYQQLSSKEYDVLQQAKMLMSAGGEIFACGTCIQSRGQKETEICPISTMKDLHQIVAKSDKLLTF